MLPDNNPILRVEFPGAPAQLNPAPSVVEGESSVVLPPNLKEGAEKVQNAAQGGQLIQKGKEKVMLLLEPIRLALHSKDKEGKQSLKEGKVIIEKLLQLAPFKIPQILQQSQSVRTVSKEESSPNETKPPVSKQVTSAKEEALTSDQKKVEEEIEGVARPQEGPRLEHKRERSEIAQEKSSALQNPPSQKKNDEPGKEVERPREIAKEEKVKTEPLLKDQNPTPIAKGQTEVSTLPSLPAAAPPIFPQPFIMESKAQNLPEQRARQVEEIARVEGVQPIYRDPNARVDRFDPTFGIVPLAADDRDIVRIPLSPDMPLTRQNLFKKQSRAFIHSQEDEGHALGDLVYMLVCAFICGANDLGEVWRYLKAREALFQKWLNLKNGIPTYRFLVLFMARLTPQSLEKILCAITGQGEALHALQRIRLWETDRGILLGHSSKEMQKCLPKDVLDLFVIQQSVLQFDLPALNPSLMRTVKQREGHYLHRIKPTDEPYQQLLTGFKEKSAFRDVREMGRITELREIEVQPLDPVFDLWKGWESLACAVRFNSELLTESKHTLESRIYLTDLNLSGEQFSHTLRTLSVPHWVEWTIDFDLTDWSQNLVPHHCEQLKIAAWQLLERQKKSPLELRKKALSDFQLLAQIIRFH